MWEPVCMGGLLCCAGGAVLSYECLACQRTKQDHARLSAPQLLLLLTLAMVQMQIS